MIRRWFRDRRYRRQRKRVERWYRDTAAEYMKLTDAEKAEHYWKGRGL